MWLACPQPSTAASASIWLTKQQSLSDALVLWALPVLLGLVSSTHSQGSSSSSVLSLASVFLFFSRLMTQSPEGSPHYLAINLPIPLSNITLFGGTSLELFSYAGSTVSSCNITEYFTDSNHNTHCIVLINHLFLTLTVCSVNFPITLQSRTWLD